MIKVSLFFISLIVLLINRIAIKTLMYKWNKLSLLSFNLLLIKITSNYKKYIKIAIYKYKSGLVIYTTIKKHFIFKSIL